MFKISILLAFLDNIMNGFDLKGAEKVKEIESVTNHDVKAIEYYIKEQLDKCTQSIRMIKHNNFMLLKNMFIFFALPKILIIYHMLL